jgi:hypothetical protein
METPLFHSIQFMDDYSTIFINGLVVIETPNISNISTNKPETTHQPRLRQVRYVKSIYRIYTLLLPRLSNGKAKLKMISKPNNPAQMNSGAVVSTLA